MATQQGFTNNAAAAGGLPTQGAGTTQPAAGAQNGGQPQGGQQSGQQGQVSSGTAAQQNNQQQGAQTQAPAPSGGYNWQNDPAYRAQQAERDTREAQLQRQIAELQGRFQQTQQLLNQREQTFIQALPADQRQAYEQRVQAQELEDLRQRTQAYETRLQYQQQIEPVRQQVMMQYGPQALQYVNWDNPLTIGTDILMLPQRMAQGQQVQQGYGYNYAQQQPLPGYGYAQQQGYGTAAQQYNLPPQGMQQQPMGMPTNVQELAALIGQVMRDNWQQISNNQVDVGGGVYSDVASWEAEAQALRRSGNLAGSIAHQARHPSLAQRR